MSHPSGTRKGRPEGRPLPCIVERSTVNDNATEEFASIAPGTDSRLRPLLMFHKVPEGKTVKNRVHIDLQAADIVVEADRLTSLGAQQIRSLAENNNRWISMRDPEGNEFDLVARG